MILRLTLVFIASEGIYLLLASRAPRFPSVEHGAAWVGLFLLYAYAVRALTRGPTGKTEKKDPFSTPVTGFILLSSVVFRATYFPFGAPDQALALRGAAYAFDLTALVLAAGLLRRARRSPALILLPGWNPYIVIELRTAEPLLLLAMASVVIALRLSSEKRRWAAALALGASLWGALPAWALVPIMTRVLRHRIVVSVAIGAGLSWYGSRGVFLPAIPPDFPGASVVPSLVTVTRLLLTREPDLAIAACAIVFLGVAVTQTLALDESGSELPERALRSVGAFIFLAPFVDESWFVLVGYLAVHSSNRGFIALTATAPLTQLNAGEGGFRFWFGFAQYFPALFSLTFSWLGRKKK